MTRSLYLFSLLALACSGPKSDGAGDTDADATDTDTVAGDTDTVANDTDVAAGDTDTVADDTDVHVLTVADLVGNWTRNGVSGTDCAAGVDGAAPVIEANDATSFDLVLGQYYGICTQDSLEHGALQFSCIPLSYTANVSIASPPYSCRADFIVRIHGEATADSLSFTMEPTRNGTGECGTCMGTVQTTAVRAIVEQPARH